MRYDRDNVCWLDASSTVPATSVRKGLFGGGGVANFEIETFMLVYTLLPLHHCQLQCTRSLHKQQPYTHTHLYNDIYMYNTRL